MSARVLVHDAPRSERFRERLQRELALRCGRNARYSLRGFANFLGTDHATLSQLLRGKRRATPSIIQRLGVRIGLDAAAIDAYRAAERAAAIPGEPDRSLPEDAADLDWHAYAILELMRLREFRPDAGWIARVLGLKAQDVQVALQHLIRLGFLHMKSRDAWEDLTGGALLRREQFTLAALQRMIASSGALQAASASGAPTTPRLHGAVTLALTAGQLARVLALAENMLREASAEARREMQGERLYQLEIHCYPIAPEVPSTDER